MSSCKVLRMNGGGEGGGTIVVLWSRGGTGVVVWSSSDAWGDMVG